MPKGVYRRTKQHRLAISRGKKGKPSGILGKRWKIKDTSNYFGRVPWNKGKKLYHLRGKNAVAWKGGTSRAYKDGYYSVEYKKWRKAVFKRDDYTCQICKSMGYITAHHIKSFSKYPELRYCVSNGLTLCEECHSLTDNYKGRAKSSYKQEVAYL